MRQAINIGKLAQKIWTNLIEFTQRLAKSQLGNLGMLEEGFIGLNQDHVETDFGEEKLRWHESTQDQLAACNQRAGIPVFQGTLSRVEFAI